MGKEKRPHFTIKETKAYAALFKRLFTSLGLGHLYGKAMKTSLVGVYSVMLQHSMNVEVENPNERSPEVIKFIQKKLKKRMLPESKIQPPISVNTFFTAFFYFRVFVNSEELKGTEWVQGLSEDLEQLYLSEAETAYSHLAVSLYFSLVRHNNFKLGLYSFEIKPFLDKGCFSPFKIILRLHKAQIREFVLDNCTRKAYRVARCDINGEIIWGTCRYRERDYPVYIQSHALDALEKRVDTFRISKLRLYVSESVQKGKLEFYKGKYLLEFQIEDTKYGYFVCAVSCDCIILRTFLFLTYDGTPEGEAINRALEVDKAAKDYLGLDKVSSLVETLMEAERARDAEMVE